MASPQPSFKWQLSQIMLYHQLTHTSSQPYPPRPPPRSSQPHGQMASELAGMMQKTAAEHSRMMGTGGEYAFLNNVITPFYRILKQVRSVNIPSPFQLLPSLALIHPAARYSQLDPLTPCPFHPLNVLPFPLCDVKPATSPCRSRTMRVLAATPRVTPRGATTTTSTSSSGLLLAPSLPHHTLLATPSPRPALAFLFSFFTSNGSSPFSPHSLTHLSPHLPLLYFLLLHAPPPGLSGASAALSWVGLGNLHFFDFSFRSRPDPLPHRSSHTTPSLPRSSSGLLEQLQQHQREDFSSKSRLSKTLFVEWRSFLHLYRSFDRMWAFLLLMFQGMAIVAFSGQDGSTTLMKVLSVVPMAAILRFFQVLFDILLSFGAYRSMSVQTISRKFLRLAVLGAWGGFLSFFLIMYFKSGFDFSSPYRPLFLMLAAIYVIPAVVLSVLMRFVTPLRSQLDRVSHHRFFQFVKWFYQDEVYTGRGMYESFKDTFLYSLFWVVLLLCKCLFSYYFQILPLVGPTRYIIGFKHLKYRWKDLVSASNYNALTLLSIWAPVFVIYLLDAQIWYTVLSAILSTLIGAWWHLGEIRTLSMLRARFRSFPAAFMNTVHHQNKFNRTR
ncbi:unnamed protein product, partial [Closterium sp. NIES-54]